MDKNERIQAHNHYVPETYVPNPRAHLSRDRDRKHYDFSVRELNAYNCKKVLDVGVWDGWLDFLLMDQGFQLEGTEIDPNLCKAASNYASKHYPSYVLHQGFLDELSFNSKFDAILCYEVLEHIPYEAVPAQIQKMLSLAPLLLISLPDQNHLDNQPQHLWTPTREKIDYLFEGAKVEYQYFTDTTIPNWMISFYKND